MKTSSKFIKDACIDDELNASDTAKVKQVHRNMDKNTKKALLKTLKSMNDEWMSSTVMSISKGYSSRTIAFNDILDEIDSILYGEEGGEATLEMLQSTEYFKIEFLSAYEEILKENAKYREV